MLDRAFPIALIIATLSPAPASADAGRRAIEKLGCVSCHEVPGFRADARTGCVPCHQKLAAKPRTGLGRAPIATHYLETPDLATAARRLRAEYLVAYLMDPHDARPHLEETMPRLPISRADAEAIVGYLRRVSGDAKVESSPAPSRANLVRGKEVFVRAGCGLCHTFGNLDLPAHVPDAARIAFQKGIQMAPNLRFVRDRMDADVALAWIRDPVAVDPGTHMPNANLSREDAIAVRDFLYLADAGTPAPTPRAPTMESLGTLPKGVRFADVRRVFGRSCIHCHAHTTATDVARGLGFEASALDLASYEGVMRGALRPDGTRVSIVDSTGGELPLLLARLFRRHAEAGRDVVPPRQDPLLPAARARPDAEPVGMPLGLPPVPLSDLRVIAGWIAAGSPR